MDAAGEAQVRKVELPQSSTWVKGEKKQKVENKKAFVQKGRGGRRQNWADLLPGPAEFSSSKGFLVVANKVGSIVKVFDVLPSILFWTVLRPPYKVFDGQALTFPDCAFIEKAVNFEGLVFVSVTLHKHWGGLMRIRALERILGRV